MPQTGFLLGCCSHWGQCPCLSSGRFWSPFPSVLGCLSPTWAHSLLPSWDLSPWVRASAALAEWSHMSESPPNTGPSVTPEVGAGAHSAQAHLWHLQLFTLQTLLSSKAPMMERWTSQPLHGLSQNSGYGKPPSLSPEHPRHLWPGQPHHVQGVLIRGHSGPSSSPRRRSLFPRFTDRLAGYGHGAGIAVWAGKLPTPGAHCLEGEPDE